MAIWHPSQIRDRSATWMELWRSLRERDLRPLVTRELIREHARNPTGGDRSHSSELTLVLNFVRILAGPDKDFIYAIRPFEEYAIGRLQGRGNPVDRSDPQRFTRKEDAMHVVFVRRLRRAGLIGDDLATELLGRQD